MISFVNKYAENFTYSQNGEEGILQQALFRMIGRAGHVVEIGGHDGKFCSNSAWLIDNHWTATFVETDWNLWKKCSENYADNPRVKCICSHVDEYNINAFVDDKCDVLSLDTDGSDYKIFCGLRVSPKIVIIEIDSSIPPDQWGFNSDGAAGYREMVNEARVRDYFLLAHTGNLVLIRNEYRELFPEIVGDGLENAELYFNRAWLKDV